MLAVVLLEGDRRSSVSRISSLRSVPKKCRAVERREGEGGREGVGNM